MLAPTDLPSYPSFLFSPADSALTSGVPVSLNSVASVGVDPGGSFGLAITTAGAPSVGSEGFAVDPVQFVNSAPTAGSPEFAQFPF